MVNPVSRREVLNNLIRFKDHLLEVRSKEDTTDEDEEGERERRGERERVYKALLNRKTGDIRFTQKITALEHHIGRKGKESVEDWKEIQIIVHQKTSREGPQFEVCDSRNHPIKPSEIEALAWRVASETIDVLNQKGKEVRGIHPEMLPEEAALHDLSSIHLAPPKERIESLPGWVGAMSRLEAEKELEGKGVGTYLLREGDEITVSIAFHFSEENFLSVHPYILTVVEREEKISDILLLETDRGWAVYQDDPNLKDPTYQYYPSPQAILHSLSQVARYPLRHHI